MSDTPPNYWTDRLKQAMGRDLTPTEAERAIELHNDGRPVALIAQELTAIAVSSEPTAPEHIMRKLRLRLDLDSTDTSRDAELAALSPLDKLRHVAAWELGDERWADQLITWAKECGIQITDPRD